MLLNSLGRVAICEYAYNVMSFDEYKASLQALTLAFYAYDRIFEHCNYLDYVPLYTFF